MADEQPPENRSAVTHPDNAMPGHPALTNIGTIYNSDADDSPGCVTEEAVHGC